VWLGGAVGGGFVFFWGFEEKSTRFLQFPCTFPTEKQKEYKVFF